MELISLFLFIYLSKFSNCISHLVSCFLDNGTYVKTTYGDKYGYGYGVVLKIGTSAINITSNSSIYKNVRIKTQLINISDQVGIVHTIHNMGKTSQTVSAAIHADTQIYNNDRVQIYRVNPMKGIKFSEKNYTVYLLFLKKHQGRPAVDSIWYGRYKKRYKNLWVNASSSSYTTGDLELSSI